MNQLTALAMCEELALITKEAKPRWMKEVKKMLPKSGKPPYGSGGKGMVERAAAIAAKQPKGGYGKGTAGATAVRKAKKGISNMDAVRAADMKKLKGARRQGDLQAKARRAKLQAKMKGPVGSAAPKKTPLPKLGREVAASQASRATKANRSMSNKDLRAAYKKTMHYKKGVANANKTNDGIFTYPGAAQIRKILGK